MKTTITPPTISEKFWGNAEKDINKISGAIFSEDRQYRYVLWRQWSDKPFVAFVGLNPSTANETQSDNTITKVIKIAKGNGYGGLYMLNLFGIISSDPSILHHHPDPIGNCNYFLATYGRLAKDIVFCWGSFKEASYRGKFVSEMFKNPLCLKINANGSPKHPLYCKDDSKLIPFL